MNLEKKNKVLDKKNKSLEKKINSMGFIPPVTNFEVTNDLENSVKKKNNRKHWYEKAFNWLGEK